MLGGTFIAGFTAAGGAFLAKLIIFFAVCTMRKRPFCNPISPNSKICGPLAVVNKFITLHTTSPTRKDSDHLNSVLDYAYYYESVREIL